MNSIRSNIKRHDFRTFIVLRISRSRVLSDNDDQLNIGIEGVNGEAEQVVTRAIRSFQKQYREEEATRSVIQIHISRTVEIVLILVSNFSSDYSVVTDDGQGEPIVKEIKAIQSINLDQAGGIIEGRVMSKSTLKTWEKDGADGVLFSFSEILAAKSVFWCQEKWRRTSSRW